MTLWRTVAKLWCHKLCVVFGPPCSIPMFTTGLAPHLQCCLLWTHKYNLFSGKQFLKLLRHLFTYCGFAARFYIFWFKCPKMSQFLELFGQLIHRKPNKNYNWCHQMSDFKAKMHRIWFPLELRRRPHWRSSQSQCFLRPPSWLKRILFLTGKGERKERKGRKKSRKRKGRRKERKQEKEGRHEGF